MHAWPVKMVLKAFHSHQRDRMHSLAEGYIRTPDYNQGSGSLPHFETLGCNGALQ